MTGPSSDSDLINELAWLSGVLPSYHDMWGREHTASMETKKAILNAMGIEISEETLFKRRLLPWSRFLDPVMVVPVESQPIFIPIHFRLDEGMEGAVSVGWSLKDENGHREEWTASGLSPTDINIIDGIRYVRLKLSLGGNRDIGYYDVDVSLKSPFEKLKGTLRLIIAPSSCHMPRQQTWGITINLYSINSGHSSSSIGVGDLQDLKEFVKRASGLGAGFVGINPLHAIPNKRPYGISPYSPISRLYKNFIYLSTESCKMPQEIKVSPDIETSGEVPYEEAAQVKYKALKESFASFYKDHYLADSQSAKEFKSYMSSEGRPLDCFATYMAIGQRQSGIYDFREWPHGFREGMDSPEVSKFKETHIEEVLFYKYIQWLIERELRDVCETARASGMLLGLYNDLAVGSIKGGADAWTWPKVFANGISMGAPPDAFNPGGQDWGVNAFIPERLREQGYEPFIEIIRKNLKCGGALRIDHALGLFRAFWVPEGMGAEAGAYIRYPYEELLGIIALESAREKAVIIAEDLGTVTDEARSALKRYGMLSYRLFYFERRWPDRDFLPPHAYPELALASVTTHDLPTLYGWWKGRDIEVKRRLGLYPEEGMMLRDIKERELDKSLMLHAVKAGGFLPDSFPADAGLMPEMPPELCLSVYGFLSSTPCLMAAVSLDDVLGVLDQQNMPGTVREYPNWLRKTDPGINAIFDDERVKALKEVFKDRSGPGH